MQSVPVLLLSEGLNWTYHHAMPCGSPHISTESVVMIILDTNVVSELMLPSPALRVSEWIAQQPASDLFLTTITEAELRYGVEILPVGRRRDRLLAAIEGMLSEDFAGRILPFDSNAARAYSVIGALRRAAGQPIDHSDCQIAAIARSMRASVATRNVRDFEDSGVALINPWSEDQI